MAFLINIGGAYGAIFENAEASVKCLEMNLSQAADGLNARKNDPDLSSNNKKESYDDSDDESSADEDEDDFEDLLEDIKTYTRSLLDLTPWTENPAEDETHQGSNDSDWPFYVAPVPPVSIASSDVVGTLPSFMTYTRSLLDFTPSTETPAKYATHQGSNDSNSPFYDPPVPPQSIASSDCLRPISNPVSISDPVSITSSSSRDSGYVPSESLHPEIPIFILALLVATKPMTDCNFFSILGEHSSSGATRPRQPILSRREPWTPHYRCLWRGCTYAGVFSTQHTLSRHVNQTHIYVDSRWKRPKGNKMCHEKELLDTHRAEHPGEMLESMEDMGQQKITPYQLSYVPQELSGYAPDPINWWSCPQLVDMPVIPPPMSLSDLSTLQTRGTDESLDPGYGSWIDGEGLQGSDPQ